MSRIVKFLKTSGGKEGQETKEMKRVEGLAYIERLKKDENVLSVEEKEKEIIITLE